jgi:hypothetical protein
MKELELFVLIIPRELKRVVCEAEEVVGNGGAETMSS